MPSKVRHVGISESLLSVDRALSLVSGPAVGGIALFVGTVRDSDHGAGVVSLDYTQHPSAIDVLAKCAEDTADYHDVLAIAVEHRVGHLEIGDIAVVVAVGAVHRGEALAACAHLINTLKAEVPIWKEQHFTSGVSEWVGLPSEDGELRTEPFDKLRTAPIEAQDSALRQAQGAKPSAQGAKPSAQGAKSRAQSAVG
jgi:molybdopterin synthase catalytic subunit